MDLKVEANTQLQPIVPGGKMGLKDAISQNFQAKPENQFFLFCFCFCF
jgi:hypothetical protein